MRIAINALSARVGGGLTYMRYFLPALAQVDSKNEYLVIVSSDQRNLKIPEAPNFRALKVKSLWNLPPLRILFEQSALPLILWRQRVDLLYAPADTSPLLAPCKVVMAARNPNLYADLPVNWSLGYRMRFALLRAVNRLSARKAAKVVSVSDSWREAIARKTGISPGEIETVHHGRCEWFKRQEVSADFVERKFGVKMPYILSVSSIYRYKNFTRLIRAFGWLKKEKKWEGHLAIVGRNLDPPYFSEMKEAVKEERLEGAVFILDHVEHRLLPLLYSGASLFVFPSYLETFGHPLLEAMACEVPIACSDIPVFREIASDAAIYFDPFSVNDMAEAIWRGLSDAILREKIAARGRERVKHFSWTKTAEKMVEIFKRVGEEKPSCVA